MNANQGLIKDSYELLLKEIQSVVAVLYIVMVGMGMLFEYQKYKHFEIDIFEYADILDFLIAPFGDLKIILLTLFAFIIFVLVVRFDIWYQNKFPRLYKITSLGMIGERWRKWNKIMLFLFFFPAYVFHFSTIYGEEKKENITQANKYIVRYENGNVLEGHFIGKSGEVIFLYCKGQVKLISMNSSIDNLEILPLNKK